MWLSSLFARRNSPPALVRRKPAPTRLSVEVLEDRAVLSFLAPVPSPGGGVQLAVGDFNQDGRDDVAALGGTIVEPAPYVAPFAVVAIGGKASVSLSNRNGTFQPAQNLIGAKGYYLAYFQAHDVNGDGNLDVVASTFSQHVDKVKDDCPACGAMGGGLVPRYPTATAYFNVWLGNGDGTFQKVKTTSVPNSSNPYWGAFPPPVFDQHFTSADFNDDGIYDLAMIDSATEVVSLDLSYVDWRHPQPEQTYPAGPKPSVIAAGDFNGDGWIDLIVANELSSPEPTLSVLLNDGNW